MKISANTLITRHSMELRPDGVDWIKSEILGGGKFFRFEQIVAVLRGPRILSFQVGMQAFSIPIDPNNPEHRTFAARLASEVKRSMRKN